MATIRKQWLLFSKDNAPSWWQPKQVVRIVPYKDDDRAFILQAVSEELGRRKGYSTITVKNQLYSVMFQDGDYKAIPHDNPNTIVIYPIKSDTGTNESDNIDEKQAELDIDLNNCTTEQMLIWTRAQAIKNIQKGRIPQALVQTLQFAVDITERLEKLTAKPLSKREESNREALIELIQDASIDAEKRAKLQMMYDKQYNTQGKAQEFKTIVREVKDETTSS